MWYLADSRNSHISKLIPLPHKNLNVREDGFTHYTETSGFFAWCKFSVPSQFLWCCSLVRCSVSSRGSTCVILRNRPGIPNCCWLQQETWDPEWRTAEASFQQSLHSCDFYHRSNITQPLRSTPERPFPKPQANCKEIKRTWAMHQQLIQHYYLIVAR